MQIESKDDIKKRLGFSPDKSDGLALTFAVDIPAEMGDMTAMEMARTRLQAAAQGRGNNAADWDPIGEDRW